MKFLDLYRSGRVTRCHATPELPGQTLAEHQWNVAMILWSVFDFGVNFNELLVALTHDVGELTTGDIHGPFKERLKADFPEMATEIQDAEEASRRDLVGAEFSLMKNERLRLNFADKMDFFLFAITRCEPTQFGKKIRNEAIDGVTRAVDAIVEPNDRKKAIIFLLEIVKNLSISIGEEDGKD